MPSIRVFVADDHAVLRAGLKLLLNAQSYLVVVGEAADATEAVRGIVATNPDVVLLDLTMPGSRSTQTIERLVRLAPRSRVLVLTMHDDPAFLRAALLAGAFGYLVKKAADVELLSAIRAVHRGRTVVGLARPGEEAWDPAASRDAAAASSKPLSPREAEVLQLLARGHTNQEAATRLTVSVKTVETHRRHIFQKLGLKNRAQLFRFAFESGVLNLDGDGGPAPDQRS